MTTHRLMAFMRGNLATHLPFDGGQQFLNAVPVEDALKEAARVPERKGRYDYFCSRCGHEYGHTDVLMPPGDMIDHVCPYCDKVKLVACYCRECGMSLGLHETEAEHLANSWHDYYKAKRPDPDAPYDRCLG